MLKALKGYDYKEAQGYLANIILDMMPHIEGKPFIVDKEIRNRILEEVYNKLKIRLDDQSNEARSQVIEFMSSNISKLALANSDIVKIRNRIGHKGLLRNDSYKIEFTDAFKKESQILSMRSSHVKDAINNPHLVDHLIPELFGGPSDKSFSIYFKTISLQNNIKDIFSIIVLTRRNGDTQAVLNAWRIYHSDVNLKECDSALDVLKAFVNVYGVEFEVGLQKEKFILYERIPLASRDESGEILKEGKVQAEIIKFNRGEMKSFSIQCLVRVIEDPRAIEVAIAFIINLDNYKAELRRHGLQIP